MKKLLGLTALLMFTACSSTHTVNGRKGGSAFCTISQSGCLAEAAKECAKVGQGIDWIQTRVTACSFGICDYQALYQCKGKGGGLSEKESVKKVDITIRNK